MKPDHTQPEKERWMRVGWRTVRGKKKELQRPGLSAAEEDSGGGSR